MIADDSESCKTQTLLKEEYLSKLRVTKGGIHEDIRGRRSLR